MNVINHNRALQALLEDKGLSVELQDSLIELTLRYCPVDIAFDFLAQLKLSSKSRELCLKEIRNSPKAMYNYYCSLSDANERRSVWLEILANRKNAQYCLSKKEFNLQEREELFNASMCEIRDLYAINLDSCIKFFSTQQVNQVLEIAIMGTAKDISYVLRSRYKSASPDVEFRAITCLYERLDSSSDFTFWLAREITFFHDGLRDSIARFIYQLQDVKLARCYCSSFKPTRQQEEILAPLFLMEKLAER